MYYKSRTDLTIVQTPQAPTLGPAGSSVTDPDFSNLILRVTDETTANGLNMYSGIGGSADVNVWNTNSTLLYLQDSGGGGAVFSLDPVSMGVNRVFSGWRVPGPLVFSKLDPTIAFNLNGTQFLRYDLSDTSTPIPPSPVVVCDFAGSLPGPATWRTIGGVEGADKVFTAAFSVNGAQGTGVYACAYLAGQGYRVLNTATGIVSGGPAPLGPISIPDRFTIHNVKSSKDGRTLTIGITQHLAGTGRGPFFWDIDSLNVYPLGTVASGGHGTTGIGAYFNNSSNAKIPTWSYCERLLSATGAPWRVANPSPNPEVMYGLDDHPSYNGADGSLMVTVSTSTTSKTIPPAPYPAAWWDEVLGFDQDGSGRVYRFCHHFSSTHSGNFYADNAIGSVDQLNTFVAFTSNWQLSLANGRSDVFVVKLR